MKKILNLAALILSVILAAGVKLLFHACAPKDDGTWMHCHSAENTVCICGAVMAVLLLVMLLIKNRKIAALLGFLVMAGGIVTALIPNKIIHLCMMDIMQCHSVMKPAVILLSLAVALLSLLSAGLYLKKE